MRRKDFPVTIHRQRKEEAEQAIKDLEERGFVVIYPLTELKSDGKRFRSDSYQRKVFVENTFNNVWVAKLRKVEEQ